METNGRLLNMLTGYAASRQHPFNLHVPIEEVQNPIEALRREDAV